MDDRISKSDIQTGLRRNLARTIPRLCFVIGGLYLLIVILELIILQDVAGTLLPVSNFVTSILFLIIAIGFTMYRLSEKHAESVFFLCILLAVSNAMLRIYIIEDTRLPGLAFILLGVSFYTASLRTMLAAGLVAIFGTSVVYNAVAPDSLMGFLHPETIAGVVVSIALAYVNISRSKNLVRTSIKLENHTKELEDAVTSISIMENKFSTRLRKLDFVGVMIFDTNARVIFQNEWSQKLFPDADTIRPGDLRKIVSFELLNPDLTPIVMSQNPVAIVLQTGKRVQNKLYASRTSDNPDTEIQWWLISAFPIYADDESLTEVVMTFSDVTELKRNESTLKLLKENAEAASQSKDEFLANMSHEIRTPLNAILGTIELLDDIAVTKEEEHHLRVIRNSGSLLAAIVNDILDISRIESGEVDLESIEVNLHQLIDEVVSIFLPSAEEKSLTLSVELNDNVPNFIMTDPTRLSQVLTNLIGNAIKFTRIGGIHVYVDIGEERDDKLQIKFVVTDTGIGIHKDRLSEITKPFTQQDSSTTREYGGTGLGLSITQHLIGIMGGHLDIDSQLGQGTTIRMYIYANKVKDPSNVSNPNSFIRRSDSDRESKNRAALYNEEWRPRILVVEDNAQNRLVAMGCLEKLGCIVDTVDNGQECVDLLPDRIEHYDLIFMDLQMPVMGGLDATAIIRSKGFDIPIIALTANATANTGKLCLDAKMNDFLTKPISIKRLRDKLEIHIPPPVTNPDRELISSGKELPGDMPPHELILLVEDDPSLARMTQTMIEAKGHKNILVEYDGLSAIEQVEKRCSELSLVLLDWNLPDIPGEQVFQKIRAIDEKLPVVIATGESTKNLEKKFQGTTNVTFLSKPFTSKQLFDSLANRRVNGLRKTNE